jgi:hypothetical protein
MPANSFFWECRHCTLAEGRVAPFVRREDQGMLRRLWWSHKLAIPEAVGLGLPDSEAVAVKDEDNRKEMYNAWLRVMKNYSARALTVPIDVLPALAGVAGVFQAWIGDAYLAGLFEAHLLESLLWKSVDTSCSKVRPNCTIPFWSWASLIGGVVPEIAVSSNFIFPELVGTKTARILEAQTFLPSGELSPPNHLTDIAGGQISIEGHVIDGAQLASSGNEHRACKSFIDTPTTISGHLLLLHLGI